MLPITSPGNLLSVVAQLKGLLFVVVACVSSSSFPPVGDDVTFNSWISRVRTRLLDGVQELRLLLALDLPILLLASGGTLPLLGIVLEHAVVVVVDDDAAALPPCFRLPFSRLLKLRLLLCCLAVARLRSRRQETLLRRASRSVLLPSTHFWWPLIGRLHYC